MFEIFLFIETVGRVAIGLLIFSSFFSFTYETLKKQYEKKKKEKQTIKYYLKKNRMRF